MIKPAGTKHAQGRRSSTTTSCTWTTGCAGTSTGSYVNNSKRSNEQVLRIAQGRGNQENLIKDFKTLGLAHSTHRLAGGESSLLHDRGTGLELEDLAGCWTSGMAR